MFFNGEFILIDEIQDAFEISEKVYVSVDRLTNQQRDDAQLGRLTEAIELAFQEGKDLCTLYNAKTKAYQHFSKRFERDGINFQEPNVHFFAFNNPFGACKRCEGYGMTLGIDEELVIPDRSKSVY